MADVVLKLQNITKTYILGSRRDARRAQKAIGKLRKRYERQSTKGQRADAAVSQKLLDSAQELFSQEKYAQSYQTVTGKRLKGKTGRGTVVHALNGVDLEIKAGELVAIMGPSGSGKSTLLNMLGLLDQPSSGSVYIQGRNISAIKPRELPQLRSQELGFVFQSYNLVPTLTALENVMLPLKYSGIGLSRRKVMAKEALASVDLGDRLQHTPNELSGGQQQRVAIARSIVNNPAIIFGDELTGELDTKMTAEIMKLILQLNRKGQTFIIVTHNPEVAKLCRRIIFMRDGKVEKQVRQTP